MTKSKSKLFIILTISCFLMLNMSCEKEKSNTLQTGSVNDNEGNVYSTVKIGSQWWMAENLRTMHYNDGSPVQLIESDTALWTHDSTGAYCAGSYGMLYNWYAIHSSNHQVVPVGWHIPTDDEWKTLEEYLGMSADDASKINWRGTNEGEKLKMTGVENWFPHTNVWATNETGFSALAGNCRLFNGKWGNPIGSGYMGFWWSSSENTAKNQAWYRYLDYKNANVFRFYGPKSYGFSVRCVRD